MSWQDILKRTYTPEEQAKINAAIAEREGKDSKLEIPTGELPDWAKQIRSEQTEEEPEKSKEEQIREMARGGATNEKLPDYLQEVADEPSEEEAPPNPQIERTQEEYNTDLDTHTENLRNYEELLQSGNVDPQQMRTVMEELEESSNTLSESIRQMINIAEEAPIVSEERTGDTPETIARRRQGVDLSKVIQAGQLRDPQNAQLDL